jgi:hypothetical protein
MSRRVYLLGLGLALVALALAFTDWTLSLRPGVSEANARRIRLGMSLSEVERILGRPPDGESVMPLRGVGSAFHWGDGATGTILVQLDEQARVWRVEYNPGENPDSLLTRLRAWLGW